MGPRELHDMAAQNITDCGKKLAQVRVVSFPELPTQIISPCSLEKRITGLVGEYLLLPLFCRPALVISTPLQPLMDVDCGKQRFPDGGSFMISGFIELTANSFGLNWTIQMLIQRTQQLLYLEYI